MRCTDEPLVRNVPKVRDGQEEIAFERFAIDNGIISDGDPLSHLFLDPTANIARKAWVAAIKYVNEQTKSSIDTHNLEQDTDR